MPCIPTVFRRLLTTLVALSVAGLPLALPAPAEAATRTLKVLVVPVHFGTKLDTKASATKLVQTQTGGWLRSVSRDRVRLKSSCASVTKNAEAAATKKGYRLSRYDVVIVLAPTCSKYAGWDHAVGRSGSPDVITLYGRRGRTLPVLLRRLGEVVFDLEGPRNYGCIRNDRYVTIEARKYCFDWPANNDLDVAGGGQSSGSFSAPELAQLGWLGKGEVATQTGGRTTVAVAPLLGKGIRAVKVVHRKAVYWVEYRRPAGVDRALPRAQAGVRLWRLAKEDEKFWGRSRNYVLDMVPDTPATDPLRPGSTWTSPEGLEFRVGAVDSRQALVTVRFGAAKPRVPAAPRVSAAAGDGAAVVAWTPGADRGRPVVRYDIQSLDAEGRVTNRHETRATDPTKLDVSLPNGRRSTVRVRAWNDEGPSAWGTTRVTPQEQRPSVRIISPKQERVVTGRQLTVVFEARPHPRSGADLLSLDVSLSSQTRAVPRLRPDGRWTATVDVAQLGSDGSEEVEVEVADDHGRSTAATVPVTVPRRMTAPVILQPMSDPAVWDGDAFTVRVDPGVDRLTGAAPQRVEVYAAFGHAYATADDHWTVTFDRSVLPHTRGDPIPPLAVSSQGSGVLESETVQREIVVL